MKGHAAYVLLNGRTHCRIHSQFCWSVFLIVYFARPPFSCSQIHEHILIHGDIRKKTVLQVAGETVEVEAYMDEDEADDEGVVKYDTAGLANRSSFLVMRDRMKARGVDVRASLDMSHGPGPMGGFGLPAPQIEQGCVILAVTDMFVVELFRREFAQLPGGLGDWWRSCMFAQLTATCC